MLVRLEKTENKNVVLVVDELDRFCGEIFISVFHKHCLLYKEPVEIDDYEYYHVSKEKINKYCKK